MRDDSELPHRLGQPPRQADLHHVGAREHQNEDDRRTDDEGGDLITGERRCEDPHRGHPRREQQGADVLGRDHAEVRVAAQQQQQRHQQSAGERDGHEQGVAQVLAQQQLVLVHRVAERQLESAVPALFRHRSHGHRGDEEQKDPGQQIEQRAK